MLIPRPETELLVELALALARHGMRRSACSISAADRARLRWRSRTSGRALDVARRRRFARPPSRSRAATRSGWPSATQASSNPTGSRACPASAFARHRRQSAVRRRGRSAPRSRRPALRARRGALAGRRRPRRDARDRRGGARYLAPGGALAARARPRSGAGGADAPARRGLRGRRPRRAISPGSRGSVTAVARPERNHASSAALPAVGRRTSPPRARATGRIVG